jgi:hypothetical protein
VVATGVAPDDKCLPVGVQPGQQDRRLHLRAGDGEVMVGAAQLLSAHGDWWQPGRRGADVGSHAPQGLGDPGHGAAAQRRVADKGGLDTRDARQQPGQESHRGAGVAAVELRLRRSEATKSDARHRCPGAVVLHPHPQGAEAGDHRVLVLADRAPRDRAVALGNRSEHQCPV